MSNIKNAPFAKTVAFEFVPNYTCKIRFSLVSPDTHDLVIDIDNLPDGPIKSLYQNGTISRYTRSASDIFENVKFSDMDEAISFFREVSSVLTVISKRLSVSITDNFFTSKESGKDSVKPISRRNVNFVPNKIGSASQCGFFVKKNFPSGDKLKLVSLNDDQSLPAYYGCSFQSPYGIKHYQTIAIVQDVPGYELTMRAKDIVRLDENLLKEVISESTVIMTSDEVRENILEQERDKSHYYSKAQRIYEGDNIIAVVRIVKSEDGLIHSNRETSKASNLEKLNKFLNLSAEQVGKLEKIADIMFCEKK